MFVQYLLFIWMQLVVEKPGELEQFQGISYNFAYFDDFQLFLTNRSIYAVPLRLQ
jgi:hypothetical protein